ncbi:amino acid ABC transporter permease [Enterococcus rivorum]|uniref:Amino acid ABC transporter permease n=1 Tax=Enterococcus rivorum TaxID=762845 RepID=A0A1E5KSG1_9ENTE|nr:amino acid ABC transporter permease [Enterococcus rivorum]MBP2097453.1 cystine transport system permease protein [Enterococcus rivorum]OEH80793.1 amino acid ABC transporter permease [Enterococcus rivorum]
MYIPKLDFQLMVDSLPFLLTGLPYTLGISLITFLIGNILGFFLAVVEMRPSKFLKWVTRFYISFLRGVPGLVLLFLVYFGLPYQLNALTTACICFSLTSSAFIAEIYRGSILGVEQGQWDAAYALGLSFGTVIRKIIFPQAFRTSIPALGNVAMELTKGTSLAAMITIPDIFQKAKIVGGKTFDYLSMYALVAIIYWLLCLVIGFGQRWLEKYYLSIYKADI